MLTYFWVVVLRGGEVLAASALTIVIGCVVAGVMQRFIGRERVRELFGDGGWLAVAKAWLLGMLLPVCSLGSIPIMSEMKKSGVSSGTVLAFGLTAPLFNPVSVLYGLTLASPWVVLVFSLCSLVIVSVVGLLFDYFFPQTHLTEKEGAVPPGFKRVLSVLEAAAASITGFNLACMILGIAGAVGLSLILPNGALQESVEPHQTFAPLVMLGIAVPMYLSPIAAMVQVAGMFEHGNSVGAAMTLLIIGAGINLGTLWWIKSAYGVTRSLKFLGMLFVTVIVLAYSVDRPLYPVDVKPVGHTHAFDQFCFPVHEGYELKGSIVAFQLKKAYSEIHVVAGAVLLGLLLVLGQLLPMFGTNTSRLEWLSRSNSKDWKYDTILSTRVLSACALLGLVTASVVGCFVYYPPQDEVFEELQSVNIRLGAAVLSNNWPEAAHWVPAAEDWAHKLSVGNFLRGKRRSDFQLAKSEVYLERLERLEHAIDEQNAEAARLLALQCQTDLRRFRLAFQ